MQFIKRFIDQVRTAAPREEGQGTVEYIMVTGLIVGAVVVAAQTPLATAVGTFVTAAAANITGAL
ncbi:MAG: hypothetical protein KC458_06065 [Dehalococcoidia bacterium]|nr:hypothetical protein [Dehalococcoidia bacterium]